MAPSFDCFANLLCTEDISIFEENEFGDSLEMLEEPWNVEYEPNLNQTQQFDDPIGLLPLLSDESLKVMIEKECHHLPASDYVNRLKIGVLDLEGRMDAIDWIQKVRVHFGFGPLCVYLAVNYMDRFLSACETLKERLWSIQLLAVGCVYLAAKIEETTVPPSLDLQVNETKYLFDTKTILRMELMVMSTLKWRMQAITPFSFIDYFLYKVNNDQVPTGDSILQSIQLILSTIRGIDFIQFRPSEIAAAVAVLVSMVGENQTVETEKAVSLLIQYVEKERVMKCVEMIQQLSSGSDSETKETTTSASVSVPCVPQSPIGVLEPLCLSYKSDENNTNVATSPHANPSLHNDISPDPKRKKLNTTIED